MNWQDLLDKPEPNAHFVQLYTDDEALASNVGRYLFEGLKQGESGVVIATPAHRASFQSAIRNLGADVVGAEREKRLLFLDAEQTLRRFMVAGRPEWTRFEKSIFAAVHSMQRNGECPIRAYGEMVGILWTAGEYSAAIKLEEFWNRILGTLGASLFCSYPIDVFAPEFAASSVHGILCDHTHLLSGETSRSMEKFMGVALNEALGTQGQEMVSRMKGKCRSEWGDVPAAENMILWLRENLPELAGEVLTRVRQQMQASLQKKIH